jgi:hypothetical protein
MCQSVVTKQHSATRSPTSMSKSKVSVPRRQENLKKKRKIERKAQVTKKVRAEWSRGQAQRTAAKHNASNVIWN